MGTMGVAPYLAQLQDTSAPQIQSHALTKLYGMLDVHWAEASELITIVESLAEDKSFASHEVRAFPHDHALEEKQPFPFFSPLPSPSPSRCPFLPH